MSILSLKSPTSSECRNQHTPSKDSHFFWSQLTRQSNQQRNYRNVANNHERDHQLRAVTSLSGWIGGKGRSTSVAKRAGRSGGGAITPTASIASSITNGCSSTVDEMSVSVCPSLFNATTATTGGCNSGVTPGECQLSQVSQASAAVLSGEPNRLFPSHLPSLRHSRRRPQLEGSVTTTTEGDAAHKTSNSTQRLTPKRLKANSNHNNKRHQYHRHPTNHRTHLTNDGNKSCNHYSKFNSNNKQRLEQKASIVNDSVLRLMTTVAVPGSKEEEEQEKNSSRVENSELVVTAKLSAASSPATSKTLAQAVSLISSLQQTYQHHSQQSSLISYDLTTSRSNSRQSYFSPEDDGNVLGPTKMLLLKEEGLRTITITKAETKSKPLMLSLSSSLALQPLDDTFLSSGISCPSETQSDTTNSNGNSPAFGLLYRQCDQDRDTNRTDVIHDRQHGDDGEDDDDVDNEHDHVKSNRPRSATTGLAKGTLAAPLPTATATTALFSSSTSSILSTTTSQITSSGSSSSSYSLVLSVSQDLNLEIDADHLHNLNKCRNRNPLWMQNSQLDEIHLSDIEEQLHKLQTIVIGGEMDQKQRSHDGCRRSTSAEPGQSFAPATNKQRNGAAEIAQDAWILSSEINDPQDS